MPLLTNKVQPECNGTKPLQCQHCGAIGDIIWHHDWVGGEGWVWNARCRNEVECWQRWDEQHGIAHC